MPADTIIGELYATDVDKRDAGKLHCHIEDDEQRFVVVNANTTTTSGSNKRPSHMQTFVLKTLKPLELGTAPIELTVHVMDVASHVATARVNIVPTAAATLSLPHIEWIIDNEADHVDYRDGINQTPAAAGAAVVATKSSPNATSVSYAVRVLKSHLDTFRVRLRARLLPSNDADNDTQQQENTESKAFSFARLRYKLFDEPSNYPSAWFRLDEQSGELSFVAPDSLTSSFNSTRLLRRPPGTEWRLYAQAFYRYTTSGSGRVEIADKATDDTKYSTYWSPLAQVLIRLGDAEHDHLMNTDESSSSSSSSSSDSEQPEQPSFVAPFTNKTLVVLDAHRLLKSALANPALNSTTNAPDSSRNASSADPVSNSNAKANQTTVTLYTFVAVSPIDTLVDSDDTATVKYKLSEQSVHAIDDDDDDNDEDDKVDNTNSSRRAHPPPLVTRLPFRVDEKSGNLTLNLSALTVDDYLDILSSVSNSNNNNNASSFRVDLKVLATLDPASLNTTTITNNSNMTTASPAPSTTTRLSLEFDMDKLDEMFALSPDLPLIKSLPPAKLILEPTTTNTTTPNNST